MYIYKHIHGITHRSTHASEYTHIDVHLHMYIHLYTYTYPYRVEVNIGLRTHTHMNLPKDNYIHVHIVDICAEVEQRSEGALADCEAKYGKLP
jgi:hypothetical protein